MIERIGIDPGMDAIGHEDSPERLEGWSWGEYELPVYHNPTLEGVESTWADLDYREDELYRRRGAIADAVSRAALYGDGGLRTFAGRMNVSESTVYDYLATYRRMRKLPELVLARVLALNIRYGHLRAVNPVKDDALYETLLTRVSDEGLSVGRLAGIIHEAKMIRDTSPLTVPEDSRDSPDMSPDTPADESYDGTSRTLDGIPGDDSPGSSEGWIEGERVPGEAPRSEVVTDLGERRDRGMIEGFLSLCEMEGFELTRIDRETGEMIVLGAMSPERLALIERYVCAGSSEAPEKSRPGTSRAMYSGEGLR